MNNEPAFPRPHSQPPHCAQEGMTLRDYFAAKAMQGELASQYDGATWSDSEKLSNYAYRIADAMMQARKTK